MKTSTFTLPLLLCAGLALNSYAEPPAAPPFPGHVEKMQERLLSELKLDPGREATVRGIMDEGRSERQKIMAATHKQMTALHTAQREKLAAVLTDEEMAKLDDMHEQRMARMEEKRMRRSAW